MNPSLIPEVFPKTLIRTPILSYDLLLKYKKNELDLNVLQLFQDTLLNRCIKVVSPALFESFNHLLKNNDSVAEVTKKIVKPLSRYLNRMTTRATPFALFAGAGVADVGDYKELIIESSSNWKVNNFLSFSKVTSLVNTFLQIPEIRSSRKYRINETSIKRGNVVHFLASEFLQKQEGPFQLEGLILPDGLGGFFSNKSKWYSYKELVKSIKNYLKGIDDELIDDFLFELINKEVLISDLTPPVLGMLPENYLHKCFLRRNKSEVKINKMVSDFCNLTAHFINLHSKDFEKKYDELINHNLISLSKPLPDIRGRIPLPVQTVLEVNVEKGGIPVNIVKKIRNILINTKQFFKYPGFIKNIRDNVSAILLKGSQNEYVPFDKMYERIANTKSTILNCTFNDPYLDDISNLLNKKVINNSTYSKELFAYQKYFTDKVIEAECNNLSQIDLDFNELNQATGSTVNTTENILPDFAEVFVRLVNTDNRESAVLLHSNSLPGNQMNRFLVWQRNNSLLKQLKDIWRYQELKAKPAIIADVTWGGYGGKEVDLSIRPAAYKYQIVLHGQPGVKKEYQIHLNELEFYLAFDGPALFWKKNRVRIIPRILSMANTELYGSFMLNLMMSADPFAKYWSLSFMKNTSIIKQPRLCMDNIILSPAAWQIPGHIIKLLKDRKSDKDNKKILKQLSNFKKLYHVPDIVRAGDMEDNVLFFEDSKQTVLELSEMVKRGKYTLQEEFLTDNSFVKGENTLLHE